MISTLRSIAAPLLVLSVPLLTSCSDDDNGTVVDPSDTGEVTVTVTTDGAGSSGVTVRLFSPGGTTALETATTGGDGMVTFSDLEPGGREVAVDVPGGFELAPGEQERKSVTVTAGQTASASFALLTEITGDVVEVLLNDDLTFTPATVTIAPGTTVRWRSVSTMPHTVTPDGHSEWSAATLATSGETFVHTFDDDGTFDYFCEPHLPNDMRGTVIVQ